MGWLSDAFESVKETLGFKDVGSSNQDCPLKKTALVVFVRHQLEMTAISGANVKLIDDSPKQDAQETEKETGLAKFHPVPEGNYKIEVELPSDLDAADFEPIEIHEKNVPLGQIVYDIVEIVPLATLNVRVVFKEPGGEEAETVTVLDGVKVKRVNNDTNDEAEETTPGEAESWAEFKKVPAGQYTLSVSDFGGYADEYQLLGVPPPVTLNPGETKEVILLAAPSGWIDLLFIKADTDPEEVIPELTVKAKLPGDKIDHKKSKPDGIARFEKLKNGTVTIEDVTSDDDAWEFVEITA